MPEFLEGLKYPARARLKHARPDPGRADLALQTRKCRASCAVVAMHAKRHESRAWDRVPALVIYFSIAACAPLLLRGAGGLEIVATQRMHVVPGLGRGPNNDNDDTTRKGHLYGTKN